MKSLKSSSKSVFIGERTYQTFEFPVNNFLEFIGKPKNISNSRIFRTKIYFELEKCEVKKVYC
jgi:hypothetical protein